jgi:hypothetical protein
MLAGCVARSASRRRARPTSRAELRTTTSALPAHRLRWSQAPFSPVKFMSAISASFRMRWEALQIAEGVEGQVRRLNGCVARSAAPLEGGV